MLRFAKAAVFLALSPLGLSQVSAADLRQGWLVNFQQETFSGDTVIAGYAAEMSTDFQKAGISYVCIGNHQTTFAFYPRGFGFEQAVDVAFRNSETTDTLHFAVADVRNIGKSRILSASDTKALKELLTSGGDLAYRQGENSGTFPTIGALQAIAIVDDACNR